MLEIVSDGFSTLEANAIEEQKFVHHEMSKKYGNALFLIHRFVDSNIFEKIIVQETANETWDTLKMLYGEMRS